MNDSPKRPPLKPTLLIEKLMALGLAYRQDLSDDQLRAYMTVCEVIPTAALESAFSRAMMDSPNFMPPAPAIVAAYRNSKRKAEQHDGESEYIKTLAHVERWGIELYGGEKPLELSPAGEYAFRILGGRRGIGMTKESDQRWLHAKWNEAYESFREAEKSGHTLCQGEARDILRLVKAEMPMLPAAPRPDGGKALAAPTFAELLKESGYQEPQPKVIEPDWERRELLEWQLAQVKKRPECEER